MIIFLMNMLNQYLDRSGKMKFLSQAAFLNFAADVANICYVNLHFLPKTITTNYVLNVYALSGVNPAGLNSQYVEEFKQVLVSSMFFLFLGFLIYHCLVYYHLSRDKKWAKKYVSGYAAAGAVLTMVELPFLAMEHPGWALAMLGTTLIYVFSFLGLRRFKKKEAR